MTNLVTRALHDDFLAALLAGDSVRARALVDRAVENGLAVDAVYLSVLAPALQGVGDRWESGEIGVAWEHRATAIVDGILGRLGPLMRIAPTTGRLAVLGCADGEYHDIGVRMAGDFLEAAGWEVIQLGPSVPAGALLDLVADEVPDVVGLSASTADRTPATAHAVRALASLRPRPFVVVGGRAWRDHPDAALAAGADACIDDPQQLVRDLVERFPPVDDDAA